MQIRSRCLGLALVAVLPVACGDGSDAEPQAELDEQALSASRPNLVVTAIAWSPSTPAPGDKVTFRATVKNVGGVATPNGKVLGVAFLVNGARVSWSDTHRTALAPGASVTVGANGGPVAATWPATVGSTDVTAWVDDIDRIPESNEKDNERVATVTVSKPATCRYGGPGSTLMSDCIAGIVGVNTHVNYVGSAYYKHFDDIVFPRLKELGVRHIRDTAATANPNAIVTNRLVQLAHAGVRTLFVNFDESATQYVASLNANGVQVVDAVEPPNERDHTGTGWKGVLTSFIPPMFARYGATPALSALTVTGPSFANSRDSAGALAAVFPNAANDMDVGNIHDYCGQDPENANGGGWGLSVAEVMSRYGALSKTHPIWVTENGYKMSGSDSGHSAVTERAAAKYLPRSVLFHIASKVERYYVYQLINDNAEDFGLLDDDGSPRAQFTALKNLIALTSDPGPAFATTPLAYKLVGDTTNIHSMVFEKRDGTYLFAVWQGVKSSVLAPHDAQIADVEATPRHLTLSLASPVSTATAYAPTYASGPVGLRTNTAAVPLTVSDDVLVIALKR